MPEQSDGRVLAILGFHKIGEPRAGNERTWFYIPEDTFANHLSCLRENDWTILDLAAFLRGLADPHSLPKRAALLTFDDGYRSVLDVALPWLERFRCPAVLFVPTDFIGGMNAFDKHVEPEEPICDWEALRTLNERGVLVQSRGVSHRRFSELTIEEQEVELRRSKELLENRLGRRIETFAYPYGDRGADLRGLRTIMRRTGYRAACLFGDGPNRWPLPDRYLLNRVAMGPDTDLGAELATS